MVYDRGGGLILAAALMTGMAVQTKQQQVQAAPERALQRAPPPFLQSH